jgi:uncharacterized protein (UPF0276 family)
MKVTPIGRLMFLVRSSKGRGQYVVDLAFHHGRGRCDCPDYEYRKEKSRRTCKHIRVAQEFLLRWVIIEICKTFREFDSQKAP